MVLSIARCDGGGIETGFVVDIRVETRDARMLLNRLMAQISKRLGYRCSHNSLCNHLCTGGPGIMQSYKVAPPEKSGNAA